MFPFTFSICYSLFHHSSSGQRFGGGLVFTAQSRALSPVKGKANGEPQVQPHYESVLQGFWTRSPTEGEQTPFKAEKERHIIFLIHILKYSTGRDKIKRCRSVIKDSRVICESSIPYPRN